MMRIVVLCREASDVHGTFGRLTGEGLPALHVAEPPWRDNRRNRSCIPCGPYEVRPHVSPRFGRCLHVERVEDRSHILVHAGNVAGDVEAGLHTHTLGCLLPGMRRGHLMVRGHRQRAVLASRTAMRHLMRWAAGRPFILEIPHV